MEIVAWALMILLQPIHYTVVTVLYKPLDVVTAVVATANALAEGYFWCSQFAFPLRYLM